MSRIGNMPISIPEGVDVTISNENLVTVKGPKGEIARQLVSDMIIKQNDGEITVDRPDDSKQMKSLHGLTRTLINNLIVGVVDGYEKELEINGTGYRANKQGKVLSMTLGHSHPVEMEDPEGVETTVDGNKIKITGISNEKVGQHAAEIRAQRPPEPYKGKGIKYVDEHIIRKAGKAGV